MNSESTSERTSNLWCSDCDKKRATQLHPYILCDSCYADRYSMQLVDGKLIKFKEYLKAQLIKDGLWFKDGETRQEWHGRMEDVSRGALQRYFGREKGKVGIHKKPAGDGEGSA